MGWGKSITTLLAAAVLTAGTNSAQSQIGLSREHPWSVDTNWTESPAHFLAFDYEQNGPKSNAPPLFKERLLKKLLAKEGYTYDVRTNTVTYEICFFVDKKFLRQMRAPKTYFNHIVAASNAAFDRYAKEGFVHARLHLINRGITDTIPIAHHDRIYLDYNIIHDIERAYGKKTFLMYATGCELVDIRYNRRSPQRIERFLESVPDSSVNVWGNIVPEIPIILAQYDPRGFKNNAIIFTHEFLHYFNAQDDTLLAPGQVKHLMYHEEPESFMLTKQSAAQINASLEIMVPEVRYHLLLYQAERLRERAPLDIKVQSEHSSLFSAISTKTYFPQKVPERR